MGKLSIEGQYSMAMLNSQRVSFLTINSFPRTFPREHMCYERKTMVSCTCSDVPSHPSENPSHKSHEISHNSYEIQFVLDQIMFQSSFSSRFPIYIYIYIHTYIFNQHHFQIHYQIDFHSYPPHLHYD